MVIKFYGCIIKKSFIELQDFVFKTSLYPNLLNKDIPKKFHKTYFNYILYYINFKNDIQFNITKMIITNCKKLNSFINYNLISR